MKNFFSGNTILIILLICCSCTPEPEKRVRIHVVHEKQENQDAGFVTVPNSNQETLQHNTLETNNNTNYVTLPSNDTTAINPLNTDSGIPPNSNPSTSEKINPSVSTNPEFNPELESNTRHSSISAEIPYAIPVPGKPGFVISPYVPPNTGYVDVRGFPAGVQVKDPYSGKIFLVP